MSTQVLVVIGSGGIGQAIARRQGAGKTVMLADLSADTLAAAEKAVQADGHVVTTLQVDVSSPESVHDLARAAAELGDASDQHGRVVPGTSLAGGDTGG